MNVLLAVSFYLRPKGLFYCLIHQQFLSAGYHSWIACCLCSDRSMSCRNALLLVKSTSLICFPPGNFTPNSRRTQGNWLTIRHIEASTPNDVAEKEALRRKLKFRPLIPTFQAYFPDERRALSLNVKTSDRGFHHNHQRFSHPRQFATCFLLTDLLRDPRRIFHEIP